MGFLLCPVMQFVFELMRAVSNDVLQIEDVFVSLYPELITGTLECSDFATNRLRIAVVSDSV